MFYLTGQQSPATLATCAVVLEDCVALGYADRVECWPLTGDAAPVVVKTSHAVAAMDRTPSGDLIVLASSGILRLLSARNNLNSVSSVSVFEAAGAFKLENALIAAAAESVLVHFFEGCVHLISLTGKSASRKFLLPEECGVLTCVKSWGSGWLAIAGESFFVLKAGDGEFVISIILSAGCTLKSNLFVFNEGLAVACGSNSISILSDDSVKTHATPPLGDRPAICAAKDRLAVYSGETGEIFICSVLGPSNLTSLGVASIGSSFFLRKLTDDKLLLGNTLLGEPTRLVSVSSQFYAGNFFSSIVDFPNHTAPVTQMAVSGDERITVGSTCSIGARFVRSGFPGSFACFMNIPGVADLFVFDGNHLILTTDSETFAISCEGVESEIHNLIKAERTILFIKYGTGFIQVTRSTVSLVAGEVCVLSGLDISHAAVRGSQILIAQSSGEVGLIEVDGFQLIGKFQKVVDGGVVTAVAFLADRFIAALWDAMTGNCFFTLFTETKFERYPIESQGVLVTSLLEVKTSLLAGLGDGRCLVFSSSVSSPVSSHQLGTLAVRLAPFEAEAALVACDSIFVFRSSRFSPVVMETQGAVRLATLPGFVAVLSGETVLFDLELKAKEELAVSTVAFNHCTFIHFAQRNDCFILGGRGKLGIVDTVRLKLQFEVDAGDVTCLTELVDCTNLIVGSSRQSGGLLSLYVGSARNGFTCSDSFEIEEGPITAVCAVVVDRFASASLNVISLFRVHEGQIFLLKEVHHNYFTVNLAMAGGKLCVGDLLRSVSLLSLVDLSEVAVDHSGSEPLTAMCSGVNEIACATESGELTILSSGSLEEISRLRLSERVNAICVAPNASGFAQRFIISGASGSLRVLLSFGDSDLYSRMVKLVEVITRYAEESGYLIDQEPADPRIPMMINADILNTFAKLGDATRNKILQQVASVMSGEEARALLRHVEQVTSASRF